VPTFPVEVPGGASTAELLGASPEPRSIDPSSCWIRHVVRGAEGAASAVAVGRVFFVRAEVDGEDGVNGRQGWAASETVAVLSDDGSFTVQFANAAGDDGVLHRKRFSIFTSADYEPGEEWLEFWRDPNDLIFVGTPTEADKTPSTITIKGVDLPVVLSGSLSSDVDVWDGAAPADVFGHYSRIAVLAHGDDEQVSLVGGVGAWSAPHVQALTGVASDCWIVEARLRWLSARPAAAGTSKVRLVVAGLTLEVDLHEGETSLEGAPERPVTGRQQGLVVPGPVDLRIVARYDRIFAFVAGELVAEFRRPVAWPAVPEAQVNSYGGTAELDGLHVETLAAFAAGSCERNLPGIPPATGLRGQYFNAAPQYAQSTTQAGRLARLWPLLGESEPAVDRVDPTVNFPGGTALYPPNLPGAYAARWTGAIYLDLAASDRNIRLKGLVGNVRIYVGHTLRGVELASTWAGASAAELVTGSLRAALGEVSGWYPIVIEQAHEAAAAGMILEDRAGAGAYTVVPQTRLSPIGCYADTVRFTTHRQVIEVVALAFGYQWRVEHRAMESGAFPGVIDFAALIGRQVPNIVIDEKSMGVEAQVQTSALDVVDGLIADAAGMADPKGSGQLSAQTVDYARAIDHLALRQGYESLSDISEAPLLETRIDSLLVLRSSPNEQVGVRPTGQRDLVDSFPLEGALARLDWRPGDAPRLELEAIDVIDLSPRQLTSVSWPLRPDGIGAPTVGFRQRPRSPRAALKRLHAAIYSPRRTYQGNIAVSTGSLGGKSGVDEYSRVPVPTDRSNIAKAIASVSYLAGGTYRLEVCGVDLGTDGAVPAVGRYDVTRAIQSVALGSPLATARVLGAGGTDYTVTLELWIVV
jgi:hypothetical protein